MEIKFFTLPSGKSPVLSFLQSLEKPDRAKIFGCLESIEEFGFDCSRVDFRQIDGKLWEIKIKTASADSDFFMGGPKNCFLLFKLIGKSSFFLNFEPSRDQFRKLFIVFGTALMYQ
jgi:hypothetical protein